MIGAPPFFPPPTYCTHNSFCPREERKARPVVAILWPERGRRGKKTPRRRRKKGKGKERQFILPSSSHPFSFFFSLGALIAALYAPAIPLLSSPGGGTVGGGGREPSRAEK